MEAALEISFYVLGVVFTLGMLMVLVLVRDVFFHGRFNTLLPTTKRVPTTTLDAARETAKALQMALNGARGERHDLVAYEIKHLELRIAALEDKTYSDQSDYYAAVKARERTWREWRAAHDEARQGGFHRRREMRNRLDELKQAYRVLDREVSDEYQRAVARDVLTLEELRAQGVLSPESLKPAAPAHAAQPGQAGQAATASQPGDGAAEAGAPAPPAAPARPAKWLTPLPPYPPAQGGLLAQSDMGRPDMQKSERTYVDPAFNMAGLPGGMLSGADLSRSSFAEVEFTGVHRYVRCHLVGTDLRRIELRRGESAHIFQDCDLRGASLAQAQLAGVVFRRCDLSGTHWRSARLDRVKFESCRQEGVRWEGVDLSRTVMSEDMLSGADFQFVAKPPLNLKPGMASPPELREPGAAPTVVPKPGPAPAAEPTDRSEPAAAAGGGMPDAPAVPAPEAVSAPEAVPQAGPVAPAPPPKPAAGTAAPPADQPTRED